VVELGHKVIVIDSATARPIPMVQEALAATPQLARRASWLDAYGLDSAHDYTPFWSRCEALGVAVCGHTGGHWGSRTSISNYVHNHLGLFAAGGDALCRSLYLGGVMSRHRKLQVGFLEGGVGWAGSLLADLIEHFEKRRASCLDEFDGKHVDLAALRELAGRYGGGKLAEASDLLRDLPLLSLTAGWHAKDLTDEFAAVDVQSKAELRALFADRFYFGCEADDTMVSVAFDERLHGVQLHAFFGSDLGHWDVEDPDTVVAEAYSALCKKKLLTPGQFRDFMFTNGVRFHGRANPRFFEGTVVEKEAAAVLSSS
jgi:hypothetical protein